MSWWHKWCFYKSTLFRRLRREFATCGLCQLSSSIQTRWSLSTRLQYSHILGTPHSNRFGPIPTLIRTQPLSCECGQWNTSRTCGRLGTFSKKQSLETFQGQKQSFFLNRCTRIWTSWAMMRWGSWVSDQKLTKHNFSKLEKRSRLNIQKGAQRQTLSNID